MLSISNYIDEINKKGGKALSVFLTAGFPGKENFVNLALQILNAGADMLEIGFPFSDPLADGPVIQHSSQAALDNGISLDDAFRFAKEIKSNSGKPVIMMGYANPVLSYGLKEFSDHAGNAGVNGVIIPDIPIEEYENFFDGSFENLDKILLVTPTTPDERINVIDEMSSGFVYCVSVSGTTGSKLNDKSESIEFIKRARSTVKKNKLLVGFGISSGEDAKAFAPYCDGVIVGSAVIKSLMQDDGEYDKTIELIAGIKKNLL